MAQPERKQQATVRRARSRVPVFRSIEEEAEFWDTHDSTEFEEEFEDVTDVKFVKTEPKRGITVRLGQDTLAALTHRAEELGLAPSTLARLWIVERLRARDEQSSATAS